jgi:hypothetical protein
VPPSKNQFLLKVKNLWKGIRDSFKSQNYYRTSPRYRCSGYKIFLFQKQNMTITFSKWTINPLLRKPATIINDLFTKFKNCFLHEIIINYEIQIANSRTSSVTAGYQAGHWLACAHVLLTYGDAWLRGCSH